MIVNWTIRNKLQWNFNLNSNIFIQQNAFEDIVCEMVATCLHLKMLIVGHTNLEERHDEVMTWKCFPHYWLLCKRNPFPSQRSSDRAWMLSLLLAWTSCWTNIQAACDIRCLNAHVMSLVWVPFWSLAQSTPCHMGNARRHLGAGWEQYAIIQIQPHTFGKENVLLCKDTCILCG